MRARILGGILLVLLAAAAVATGSRHCGKTGPAPKELSEYPSIEGTLCDVIAKAPPAHPRGPLPSDPALAAWTEQIESALEEALALWAIGEAHDYGYGEIPGEAETACARKLWTHVAPRLPAGDRMRQIAEDTVTRFFRQDAGSPERNKLALLRELTPDASAALPSSPASAELIRRLTSGGNKCETAPAFLAAFPDNARLRRALMMHYGACVEDNYSSVDGELDGTELFMRESVKSWPERAGLDFELLVATDRTSQNPKLRTWMWLRAPFARITLDLGMTGNALRVVRDLKKERPEIAQQLLPVARKYAARQVPSNLRARWTALVAYLEADAPDPGEAPEPALTRALEGDERSARWALGYLPNQLQEHAPRPFPYLRDASLIKATVARAELVTTDEDRILVMNVLSQMPPGTDLAWMARAASSANDSVWRAAVAVMEQQINQLRIKPPPGELEAEAERRAHTAKLLAPHLAVLHAGLSPRMCAHPETIRFLADANDKGIDAALLPCVEGKPQPDIDFLTTLFHACLDHRDLGWTKTGAALAKTAVAGDQGVYARRVANGCLTGED
jgi:hypothetical protein